MTLEPDRRTELVQAPERVRARGSNEARGFGEGLAVAIAALFLAAAFGVVALPALPAGSPRPSPIRSLPVNVLVTPSPRPLPTAVIVPQVTPSLDCVSGADAPPGALLSVDGRNVAAGARTWLDGLPKTAPGPGAGSLVEVAAESHVAIVLGGRECALEWKLEMDGVVLEDVHNPTLNPAFAAQNQFHVALQGPAGDREHRIRLTSHFLSGRTLDEWRVRIGRPVVPSGYLVATLPAYQDGGPWYAPAQPGCGFSIRIPSGDVLDELCATNLPQGPIERIYARPGSRIAFRLPGWLFEMSNYPACRTWDESFTPFVPDDACPLQPFGDPSEIVDVVTPASPGVWLVRVEGCALREALRLCGPWFGIVDTRSVPPPWMPGSDSGG